MSRQVPLHNPALMSDEELQATFVGREALLDAVLAGLHEQAPKPVNQSLLIVGARGIGKTNFVRMVRTRVLANEELRRAYQPLVFPEETYAITSARDLFCEILRMLVDATHNEAATAGWEHVKDDTDDERARETAIEALRDYHRASGRKLLVVIENLDLLLGDQIREHTDVARIRDVLMNDGFLALMATSPSHFREVSGYDRPLYEFFKLIDLPELPEPEAEELLRRRAEFEGNTAFLSRFDEYRKRLPAIRHLTGGNPRLILMLYTVLCQTALVEVKAALEALLDDLTPYYKARIERLSPQQRKILDAFAREGRPLTPTEIGTITKLPTAQVSAVLSRLQDDGFVRLAEQKRRKTRLYVVSERMFRIWHQMRMSAASRRRMQYLIEFVSLWYSAEEAQSQSHLLLAAMRGHLAHGEHIAASEKAQYLGYLAAGVADSETAFGIADEAIGACLDAGQFEEAERLIADAVGRAQEERRPQAIGWAEFWRALCLSGQGRYEETIEAAVACLKVSPSHWRAHGLWALALMGLAAGSSDAKARALLWGACSKWEEAVRLAPEPDAKAICRWGITFIHLGDRSKGSDAREYLRTACAKFEEALRLQPQMWAALYSWGVALLKLGPGGSDGEARALARQAAEKFEAAVRISPDHPRAYLSWGLALHCIALRSRDEEARGMLQEACTKYEAGLQLDPKTPQALWAWSVALGGLASTAAGQAASAAAADAVGKARRALALAAAGREEDLAPYEQQFVKAQTRQLNVEIGAGDWRTARRAVRELLPLTFVTPEMWRQVMVNLAADSLAQETVPFFRWVFGLLRKQGLEEDVVALAPVEAAVEYWEQGGDERVLERLNPEVRKIVEGIVKRGERREPGPGQTD